MTKKEIVTAKDNEIITEYVKSYSRLCLNINLNLGTKQLSKHCKDLEAELLKRGILTESNIEELQ